MAKKKTHSRVRIKSLHNPVWIPAGFRTENGHGFWAGFDLIATF